MKLLIFWVYFLKKLGKNQGLRASSLQFTFPSEFNAIFCDSFTLWLKLNGWSKIRDPVTAKFKNVTVIVTYIRYYPGGYYVVMTSRTCRRCEISKKLTWNPTLTAKNTPLFLFPYMGHLLQIFAWGMPLHAHIFSFTHNAVVLSHFRCVHPENQTKIFRFQHFYESKQTSLTQDLKWSLNNVVRYKCSLLPVSNWFVTFIASSIELILQTWPLAIQPFIILYIYGKNWFEN